MPGRTSAIHRTGKQTFPCPDCETDGFLSRSLMVNGKRMRYWRCPADHTWRTLAGVLLPSAMRQLCPTCKRWMKCVGTDLHDDGRIQRSYLCRRAGCGHTETCVTVSTKAGTTPPKYKLPDKATHDRHLAWVGDALLRTLTLEDDEPPGVAPHAYACKCAACQEFWRAWAQRFGFWGPWDERG